MAGRSNTINILKPFLEKSEEVYGDTLHFDDNESKKLGYYVGKESVILAITERAGSLVL